MKTVRIFSLRFAPLIAICLLAGCGRQSMVPVQGRVSYRGSGLNNGVVVFTPDRGPLAIGRVREDGSFILYTGDAPGAYPGNYRVTISSIAPGTSGDNWGRFEFPRSAIPDDYRHPDRSGLVCTVVPSKTNIFPVELTDRE